MRFILRWLVRLFGIVVFLRGSWLLSSEWRINRLGLPRRFDATLSSLEATLHFAEHLVVQSPFLLALSGFIIILLAFRR